MLSTKKGLLIGALSLSLGMVPLMSSAMYITQKQMNKRTNHGRTFNPTKVKYHKGKAKSERAKGRKHIAAANHYLGHAKSDLNKANDLLQNHVRQDLIDANGHIQAAKYHFGQAKLHDQAAQQAAS